MEQELSRDAFFGMAGLTENTIESEIAPYTPISLGKGHKTRSGNRAWMNSLKRCDFLDADSLRALTPEQVSSTPVFVNNEEQKQYQAIVGDNTHKVYSIRSDKYKIVQNSLMTESLAQVSENTGIQVFGTLHDEGGKMGINAFFADPDCNVDFGTHQKDPYMLGVRAYNSHTGQTGFGAQIIGVRWLCSNMVSFGQTLGHEHWKHYVEQKDVVSKISGMIESYMDKVPVLKDRIDALRNEEITITEAECLLWGIKVTPFKIEGIMSNLPELNPEIKLANGKVKVYDVFNATTAYNTYSNTGGSEFGRVGFMERAEDIITGNISRLIDSGNTAREEFLSRAITLNANNTSIVDA